MIGIQGISPESFGSEWRDNRDCYKSPIRSRFDPCRTLRVVINEQGGEVARFKLVRNLVYSHGGVFHSSGQQMKHGYAVSSGPSLILVPCIRDNAMWCNDCGACEQWISDNPAAHYAVWDIDGLHEYRVVDVVSDLDSALELARERSDSKVWDCSSGRLVSVSNIEEAA